MCLTSWKIRILCNAWPIQVGLARGYADLGNRAKALEHATIPLPQALDPINKKGVEDLIAAMQ